jgi:peptidyl-prolyl cis-trans isomerase C
MMNTVNKRGRKLMLMILAVVLTAVPAVGADAPAAAQSPATDKSTPEAAAETAPKSKNVAVVNGEAITRERYDREVDRATQRFAGQGQPPQPQMVETVKQRVLDFMVEETLLYQECKKRGIKPDEAAVDAEFAKLKQQVGSDEKFQTFLTAMNATEAEVKNDMARRLAIKELIQKEVMDEIEVTDAEVRAFYDDNPKFFVKGEQVKASHILIKVNTDADEATKAAAKAKIEKAAQRVKDGEDFATVATEVSEGPSNAKGGDLGSFQRGQMVKPFEDAAFALNPGEVSGVVETDFGYHIIKVSEKTAPSTIPFAEVKPKIEQHLKQEKTKVAFGEFVKKLKDGAAIETSL